MIASFGCSPVVKGQAPEAVKSNFKKMYPNENDPDWHLDKNGNYEAHFKKGGEKYRADYLPDGTWYETESNIKKKHLPEAVQERIEKDFDDYKIYEIERVEHHAKGLFFDVEFKIDGEKKDIEFNAFGEIIN